MKLVVAGVRHALVRLGETLAGLLVPTASLLRSGELLRYSTKMLLRFLLVSRIRLLGSVRFDGDILETEVNARHLIFIDVDDGLDLFKTVVVVHHAPVVSAESVMLFTFPSTLR